MVDIIDSSGSRPRLRIGALATAVSGTVIYGYYVGLTDFIDGIVGGLLDGVDAVAYYYTVELIPGLAGLGLGGIEAAVDSNAAWLSTLGLLGPVVAAVEILVIIWLLLRGIDGSIWLVRGLLSS